MRALSSKETPKASMPFMSSVRLTGSWFRPTMTETTLILFMIQEEFQSKKDSETEEIFTLNNRNYSIHSCQFGQLSILPPL